MSTSPRRNSGRPTFARILIAMLTVLAVLLSARLIFPPSPEATSTTLTPIMIPRAPVTPEGVIESSIAVETLVLPAPQTLPPRWDLHVISSEGDGPDGVRLTDLNLDGRFDLVTSFEDTGEVMAFFHPGPENLKDPWPSVNLGITPRGEDAMGMDVDGDGAMDIVSSHEGDTMGIYVHWGPSDSSLYMNAEAWGGPALIPESQGRGWMFALPMDINQDGRVDIVAGSKDDYFNDRNSVGDLGWFEAPETDKRNLGNWTYHSIDHIGWTMSIIPYDVNGDSFQDLLVTDRNADVDHMGARWLENPGGDWEQPWTSHFLGDLAGTRPTFMAVGDLDGDGIDEFVVPLSDSGTLIILWSIDKREERIYFTAEQGYGLIKAVAVGDLDHDGRNDIIVTFVAGQFGVVWLSKADSSQMEWDVLIISDVAGGKFDLIEMYDVDGDGDLDILTTEERHNLGVLWFENPLITAD